MKKVKLKNGLTLEIQENALNNMEMLDDLSELDEGNGYAIPRIARKLLTPEGKKAAYDHCRTEEGNVPVDRFVEILKEIFETLGDQGKN